MQEKFYPKQRLMNRMSGSDKFWGFIIDDKTEEVELPERAPELSENGKFWATEAAPAVLEKTHSKAREVSPPPSKVASPFFINRKTLKSKQKDESPKAIAGPSTSRALFPAEAFKMDERKAVDDLRGAKTSKELRKMKEQLADEQRNLAQERIKLDRMGMSITDCKELLKDFGILGWTRQWKRKPNAPFSI